MTSTLNNTDIPGAYSSRASQTVLGAGDSNLPQPICPAKATASPVAAPNFPDAQSINDSQESVGVGESDLRQSMPDSNANVAPAAATNFPDAHTAVDSHRGFGVGDSILPQPISPPFAIGGPAAALNLPDAQQACDSQMNHGAGDLSNGGHGPILADPTLAMCADVVDDLEKVKIANENRLRTLTMDGEHGHGMSEDHPDVKRLAQIVDALSAAEHQAVLNLQRTMRAHPLGPFVKASRGIGEKQAARLLASIRDPYWNDLHNRPRKLRELYRFCGMDVVGTSSHSGGDSHATIGAGVAPTKARGERVHWSPDARMRLWLIASKCVMVGHGGPYRAIYDEGRAKYADAIHAQECKRCGPKGKPAQPGSPLSAAHQHARAIRLIAKTILRDLWAEAKRLHEEKAA